MAMIPKPEQATPVVAMEQPEPTLLNRRAKVRTREVSSRFMSPMVSSKAVPNSAPTPTPVPDRQQLKYTQKWHHVQEHDMFMVSQVDANKMETSQNLESLQNCQHKQEQHEIGPLFQLDANKIKTAQSVNNTPAAVAFGSHNQYDTKAGTSIYSTYKRCQPRAKPLKENNEAAKTEHEHPTEIISQTKNSTHVARCKTPCPRPDTPNVDRIIPSRYKSNSQNAANMNGKGAIVSEAAKLLKESIRAPDPFKSSSAIRKSTDDMEMLLQKKLSRSSRSKDDSSGLCTSIARTQSGGSCPTSPLMCSNKMGVSDEHSSFQENDVLANIMSTWSTSGRNSSNNCSENINENDCSTIRNSPCFRSLDFPVSRGEHASSSSMYRLRASNSTAASASFKPSGGNHLALPPHPSSLKLGSGKGRKQHEDVHFLKLLYNHYLKWRYANARAEVLACSQEMETKRQVHSLGSKLSEMRDSVRSKRIELERLQRYKALATVVKSHIPCLDQWSALEEVYSTSLTEIVNSLHSLSLRLPTSSEVKVDITELGEALNQAIQMMETIAFNMKSFFAMAEEMESLISELAMVVNGERVLIHECGDHLFKTQTLQVEECSMRGHLIGLHHNSKLRQQKED